MKIARSYGAAGRHAAAFAALSDDYRSVSDRSFRNSAAIQLWLGLAPLLMFCAVLYIAVEILGLPAAGLLFLFMLFMRLMPRLSAAQQYNHGLLHELPAYARIMDMVSRCEAAAEKRPIAERPCEMRTSLELDRVTFRYEPGSGPPVLDRVSMKIEVGRTVAVMGPSGAGKSSIADLVMGLIAPDDGRVLVDGQPLLPEQVKSWRDGIGYVAQDAYFFHDSIRANLLWASPDAREDEIWQALKTSALSEFVSGLPRGLETNLGDRGVLVSGGERQRLALARALLRRPSLLILDEATSSLDPENEQRIL
jgi:ATP-binding cassette, subfamily C, bacterial